MMTNSLLKLTLALLSLFAAVLIAQAIFASTPKQNTITSNPNEHIKVAPLAVNQAPAATDAAPVTQQKHESKDARRSFSFHYLDILEWMFAGRGDKAKRHQSQRPSTAISLW